MPLWGTGRWGTRPWGWHSLPAGDEAARAIVGRGAPWLPHISVAKRSYCLTLHPVDGVTFDYGTPLAGLSTSGQRTAELRDTWAQQDSLSFTVADPTGQYLEDGPLADVLAPNALLGLRWTITTDAGTLVVPGNLFRVVHAPSRVRDGGVWQPLQCQAADWLGPLLDEPLGASLPAGTPALGGFSPLQLAVLLKDALLGLGAPAVLADDTWNTVVYTLLWGLSAGQLRQAPYPFGIPQQHPPLEDLLDATFHDPLAVEIGALLPTYRELFTWMGEHLDTPTRLTYDADGTAYLHWPGAATGGREESGCVVSCDPAVGGRLAVPWRTAARTLQRPEATAVVRYQSWVERQGHDAVAAQPAFMGAPAGPAVPAFWQETTRLAIAGEARSGARLQPHTPPLWRWKRSVVRLSPGPGGPNPYEQAFAERDLQNILGKADTVQLGVEPCFPFPRLGSEVRFSLEAATDRPAIRGRWALMSVQQPLGLALQTWQLEWRSDG